MIKTLYTQNNIHVLRGYNSNFFDLIATDPPFNAKRIFNFITSSKTGKVIRKKKKIFDDRWRFDEVTAEWAELLGISHRSIVELIEAAVTIEGGTVNRRTGEVNTGRVKNSIAAYICWMAPRLIEMRRVLKPTGCIYLHCDSSANAYLRLLLDAVFGRNNFLNEIVWCYKENETATRYFPRKHDTIFLYAKDSRKHIFNIQRGEITEVQKKRYNRIINGECYANMKGKLRKLHGGAKIRDWWEIPIAQLSERTGFPTQKPLELYERMIKASSNENGIVLDPFCGCSTTLVAAEKLGRQWVGIDNDPIAKDVLEERMPDIKFKTIVGDPKRTDIEILPDNKLRKKLYLKQMKQCGNKYCTSKNLRPEDLELDHIIPYDRGGSNDADNRIGLCSNCNKRKGVRSVGEFNMLEAKAFEKRMKYFGND